MKYKCPKIADIDSTAPNPGKTMMLLLFLFLMSVMPGSGAQESFANTNTIIINAGTNPPTIATPYPSGITVTGLTGQVVFKVTVTLSNLSHSFPSDIDVLLIGPQGQMAFPMSEAGGDQRYPVTNITLTVDDDAPLPMGAPLTSGTFQPFKLHQPTNYFDMPLPATPGNASAPPLLSVFNGTDPNGTWNLYVVQDNAEDSGIISGGWSINITSGVLLKISPSDPTNCVISWTNSAVGYTLQTTTNLSPPEIWSDVLIPPGNVFGQFTVTNPITDGDVFYRLIKN